MRDVEEIWVGNEQKEIVKKNLNANGMNFVQTSGYQLRCAINALLQIATGDYETPNFQFAEEIQKKNWKKI